MLNETFSVIFKHCVWAFFGKKCTFGTECGTSFHLLSRLSQISAEKKKFLRKEKRKKEEESLLRPTDAPDFLLTFWDTKSVWLLGILGTLRGIHSCHLAEDESQNRKSNLLWPRVAKQRGSRSVHNVEILVLETFVWNCLKLSDIVWNCLKLSEIV